MKKTAIPKGIGVFLFVLIEAPFAFADTAADFKKAQELLLAHQYSAAEQAYQVVLKEIDPNKPDDLKLAFDARRKLPLIYLATDRQADAQVAVQQLLAKHYDHSRLPHAIHEIVEGAKELNKTLQIGQVYQNILATNPKHSQAIWLKMGIAIANVHLNNDEAVNSALQNIITQHTDDDRAAEALGQTAWAYRKLQQHGKARTVYQYVVNNWPKKDRAVFSQRGIILCSIELDDKAATNTGLQKLLVEYANNKYMAEIVRSIAVEYYRKGMLAEASSLHQYVVDKHPESLEALWSQRDVVLCAIDEENEQAVEAALQKLATTFAKHTRLPEALADVAAYYRKKGKPAEAAAVRQYLVAQHPESTEAFRSQRDIVLQEIDAGSERATEALEKLVTTFAGHEELAKALTDIGERYRRKGNYQNARQTLQYTIAKWPQTEAAAIAQTAIAEVDILSLIQEGKEQEVQEALKNLIARYKTDPALSRILAHVGDKYQTLRQYEKAITMYRQVIELVPLSERAADVQGAIGWTYIMQELYDEAIREYGKVAEIYPESKWAPNGQYWVAQCYYKKKGDLERAVTEYQKVIDVYPESKEASYAAKKIALIQRIREATSRSGPDKDQSKAREGLSACGPSAVVVIGRLLGTKLDDGEIAGLANMDDQGLTSMYDLAQAARAKGLKATGMKLAIQDLRSLGKPVIAFIRGGHFNVIKEVTEMGVIIANKDMSEMAIPKDEFQRSWDGYVLVVEKAA